MKTLRSLTLLVLLVMLILCSCVRNFNESFDSDDSLNTESTSVTIIATPSSLPNPAPSTLSPSPTSPQSLSSDDDSILIMLQNIDARVAEIVEHKDEFTCIYRDNSVYKEYYNRGTIVYREGGEFYEVIEGGVVYRLYYDDSGSLVFADVAQYRHPSYCIYFNEDSVIRLSVGYPYSEEEHVFDDNMMHAIALCLDNAYKST